jgi:hypothetical protein
MSTTTATNGNVSDAKLLDDDDDDDNDDDVDDDDGDATQTDSGSLSAMDSGCSNLRLRALTFAPSDSTSARTIAKVVATAA